MGLKIHLMRHGMAARSGAGSWRSDEERPLSEEGALETRRAAKGLATAGIAFDRIFSSPLVRARETARLVSEAQREPAVVDVIDELAPGVVIEELFSRLGGLPGDSGVLLVGHEPDMGLLSAHLLGFPPERTMPFQPGAVTRIDVARLPPAAPGALVWMLTALLAGSLADG